MTDSTRTPPIIDISRLREDPASDDARSCIEAIHLACTDTGFFVVVGHGLDQEIS